MPSPSALRPDRPLPCPPVQGLLQLPARGFHLASEASLHFLWLLLFPLSTYLVGFQDPPRRRLGYMEVEIDTVPLLFNLVKERKKKEEFLAKVAPSKPGDPTKDPGSLDRKRPASISLPNSNGLPTPTSGHRFWQAPGLLTALCLPPSRPPLLPTPQGCNPCQALAVTLCSAPA